MGSRGQLPQASIHMIFTRPLDMAFSFHILHERRVGQFLRPLRLCNPTFSFIMDYLVSSHVYDLIRASFR